MAAINVITTPSLDGKRRAFVLAEDGIGHYPEFRAFFTDIFDLARVGLQRPGYLAAPSGTQYALVFTGRSGEPFPTGVEIYALVPALEPLDEEMVDRDLWEILRWMIGGVGGEWTLADLDATGRLYRLPAAVS
ncbi:MAG: hypothetical protein J2P48_13225 [Alphaproteobacteria bacterium]|nr:hypothetical protein [Alphaproteobacteria bacterium]